MAYTPNNDANCQAWYRLENGALTTDSSVNSNTLTNTGVVSETSDYKEGSGCGDWEYSDSDKMEIADSSLSASFPLKNGDSVKEITVCGWFKQEAFNEAFNFLWMKYDGGANKRSLMLINDASGNVSLYQGYNFGISFQSVTYGTALSTGVWYHIAVTYDDTGRTYRIRIWDDTGSALLDSDLTGAFTNSINIEDAPFLVGNIYDGFIDDVVVFNRVLTADEIDEIRNQTFEGVAATTTTTSTSTTTTSTTTNTTSSTTSSTTSTTTTNTTSSTTSTTSTTTTSTMTSSTTSSTTTAYGRDDVQLAYGNGGDTIYYRFWSNPGLVWNGTSVVAYAAIDVADYGIPFSDKGGGFYVADFPEDAPEGIYTLVAHLQVGSSQADTDNVIGSWQTNWDGEYAIDCATSAELDAAVATLSLLINLSIEAGKSTLYVSSSVTEPG